MSDKIIIKDVIIKDFSEEIKTPFDKESLTLAVKRFDKNAVLSGYIYSSDIIDDLRISFYKQSDFHVVNLKIVDDKILGDVIFFNDKSPACLIAKTTDSYFRFLCTVEIKTPEMVRKVDCVNSVLMLTENYVFNPYGKVNISEVLKE